jgi:hypothetical protein
MLREYFNLEARYDLKKIKMGRLALWPYLRIYFSYKLVYENIVVGAKVNSQNIRSIVATLFVGIGNIFRKYDYLFFSVGEQRRSINGLYYDRFDYVVGDLGKRALFFELLFPVHHKVVPTTFRTSRSILFLIEYILIKVLIFKKISGRNILDNINRDYNLNIDYTYLSGKFYAQYLIGKTLGWIYKPKAVFLITSYTNLGYLVAFKHAGIKVVEMQHGVINAQHAGYNPTIDFGDSYRPDSLLTYGSRELEVFTGSNSYIASDHVYPVGHFYFDYLIKEYKGDERLMLLTNGYRKIIAVSAEYDFEPEIIPFINNTARELPTYIFLYMPRNKKASDYTDFQLTKNFIVVDWLNAYQVMRQSDFHTCVRSTTALEAVALGTQNILIDIRGYATSYFKTSLTDSKITRFVESEAEYLTELTTFNRLPRAEIINSDNNLITPNFVHNLHEVLQKILL